MVSKKKLLNLVCCRSLMYSIGFAIYSISRYLVGLSRVPLPFFFCWKGSCCCSSRDRENMSHLTAMSHLIDVFLLIFLLFLQLAKFNSIKKEWVRYSFNLRMIFNRSVYFLFVVPGVITSSMILPLQTLKCMMSFMKENQYQICIRKNL